VSIASSLTEPLVDVLVRRLVEPWRSGARDVRHLFAFRAASLRGKSRTRVRILLGVLLLLTVAVALVPAWVPPARHLSKGSVLALMPTAYAGFLVLAATSAIASGGGRELIARDQAVAYPISSVVEHLGALFMAPLNIAWILQCWLLLGISAYALGPEGLPWIIPMTLLWVACATALAQVIAWSMEAIRRGPAGLLVSRLVVLAVLLLGAWAVATHRLAPFLDGLPLLRLVLAATVASTSGFTWEWFAYTVLLLLVALGAVLIGVLPAWLALRRMPRDEARLETGSYRARADARSDFWALVRVDRGSVWRSVPLRRGVVVLAALPGLIAVGGALEWQMMTMLPGLVASGAALLFGINAWCLDGRGALWRDALPVAPETVFAARTWVLLELLLASSAATILIAGLRAGAPSAPELTALVCTWLVVAMQVVNGAMRWSVQYPFPVDLRSARATPAPPLSMVGYSARLAWITTVTGLVFSGFAVVPEWRLSVVFALPMILWSAWRLVRVRSRWVEPVTRSRVVATVAA
jgi:hypothetical protein